jgi:hypothetical protein
VTHFGAEEDQGALAVPDGRQVEVEEHEQIVARVAAIDVAKASGMVCTPVPHQTTPGKRITRVGRWRRPPTRSSSWLIS